MTWKPSKMKTQKNGEIRVFLRTDVQRYDMIGGQKSTIYC